MGRLATALGAYKGLGAAAIKPPAKGVARPVGPPKGVSRPAVPGAPAVNGSAGGPVGGAAPALAPLPWDANYETRVGGINRNYADTIAGLGNEETETKRAYGFDDASNPFNRLTMLEDAYKNRHQVDQGSAAAAGQGFSGAYTAQIGDTTHAHDVSYDALRRSYDSDLNGIVARRTAAVNTQTDDTNAAGWERTQAALANRPDPASVPDAPAAAPATPAPAAAKGYTERPATVKGVVGAYHIWPKSAQYPNGRTVFVPKGK